MIRRILVGILLAVACAGPAAAQVKQSGLVTPGHAVKWYAPGVVGDAGGAAGASAFNTSYLTELGITNTGAPLCINDALITAQGGYHQLCFGALSLGGGLISYNAYGGASPLALDFNINGATYAFPGPGNGNVVGPNASVGNDVVAFNGTSGTVIKDTGILYTNLATGPNSSVSNDIVAFNGTSGTALKDTGILTSNLLTANGTNTYTGNNYFGSGFPVCDVRAKGATSTRGTTNIDQAPFFQACVTQLSSTVPSNVSGGILFIPPGGYCIKTAITVTGSVPIKIVGTGQPSYLSTCGSDNTFFSLNVNYSGIDGVHFEGKGTEGSLESTFGATHPNVLFGPSCGGCYWYNSHSTGGAEALVDQGFDSYITDLGMSFSYGVAMLYLAGDGITLDRTSTDQGWPVVGFAVGSLVTHAWAADTYYGSSFTAAISNAAGDSAGTQMHVTAEAAGTITVGELITGTAVTTGTQVICQLSGSGGSCTTLTGGIGYYKVSQSQQISAEAMIGTGDVVSTQGYFLQLLTNGTSCVACVNPTLQNYGANITDGTAVWLLAAPAAYYGILVETNGLEASGHDGDVSCSVCTAGIGVGNDGSGNAPVLNSFSRMTVTGVSSGIQLNAGTGFSIDGSHVYGGVAANGTSIIAASGFGGGLTVTGNPTIGGPIAISGGGSLASTITGNVFPGTPNVSTDAITLAADVSNVAITGNAMLGVTRDCLQLQPGASDFITFMGNNCNGTAGIGSVGSVTGTHNFIQGNPGYNPVGVTTGTFGTTSTSTYTAGPTAETHYLTGGTVTAVKVPAGVTSVCTGTPCAVTLGPNETFSVTYTGAPADTVSVH